MYHIPVKSWIFKHVLMRSNCYSFRGENVPRTKVRFLWSTTSPGWSVLSDFVFCKNFARGFFMVFQRKKPGVKIIKRWNFRINPWVFCFWLNFCFSCWTMRLEIRSTPALRKKKRHFPIVRVPATIKKGVNRLVSPFPTVETSLISPCLSTAWKPAQWFAPRWPRLSSIRRNVLQALQVHECWWVGGLGPKKGYDMISWWFFPGSFFFRNSYIHKVYISKCIFKYGLHTVIWYDQMYMNHVV